MEPVTVEGRVGWRNTGDERTKSQLDVYGPGGRWAGPRRQGEALIDALEREGVREGWTLTITATPPEEVDSGNLWRKPPRLVGKCWDNEPHAPHDHENSELITRHCDGQGYEL